MNATQHFLISFWTAIIIGVLARALIWRKCIRLLNLFREIGANSKEHTLALKDLEERDSWICNQLITGKILVPAADGRYYLDEEALIRYRKRQRILKTIVVAGFLLSLLQGIGLLK